MGKISDILSELKVSPSKAKGQNFLNTADASRLIDAAPLIKEIPVVEIGPGLGVMTEVLLERGYKVHAIEIERKFGDYLISHFSGFNDQFNLIRSDFREINIESLGFSTCQVISNVPYVLSSEMMLWLLDNQEFIEGASLLLQREFAERIAGTPKTKVYGSLSVHVQAYSEVSLGLILQGSVFYPPATVESRQLQIKFYKDKSPYVIPDRHAFEKVVRASFAMRRKKLSSCLDKAKLGIDKIKATEILEKMGLSENVRAEELSVQQFVDLSSQIYRN